MNKKELVASMAEKTQLSKMDAEVMLKALIESVKETVAKGEKVSLVGFGTFEPRNRSARMGHNPKTQQPIEIPATRVPVFKAGKEFRKKVADSIK